MAGVLSRRRCVVGRDIQIVHARAGEVELESTLRLRPGSHIDVLDGAARPAIVISWAVTRLGSEGTVYRGTCRWLESVG